MIPNKNTYGIIFGFMPFGGLRYVELWCSNFEEAHTEAIEIARNRYKSYLEHMIKQGTLGLDVDQWKTWKPEFEKIEIINKSVIHGEK